MSKLWTGVDWVLQRRRMIKDQLRVRGIRDERVLDAMGSVPRDRFTPEDQRRFAYEDRALPVGHAQTISQPFIVAYMTQALAVLPEHKVLEIGTGTGYQTAVLAKLSRHVYSIERIAELSRLARETLDALEIFNVTLITGDGTLGLPDHAPYDRIMVTAGSPRVPTALTDQLVDGGRLVIPVGDVQEQHIICVDRRGSRTIESTSLPCRFVRLIGEEGWSLKEV